MRIYHDLPTQPLDEPSYLTIGSFDGVHRGHQRLIGGMVDAAHTAGCQAGVLTFDPHPVAVLRPDVRVPLLTSSQERAELMLAVGADYVIVLPFTRETAATPAGDFVQRLVERLRLRALWVGPDFALGKGREGNIERLSEMGADLGYKVHVVPAFDWKGESVRSSRVRTLLLEDGAAERAGQLLGRPYQLWGEVQGGARRGRQLGYPTANIVPPPERVIPAYGIYACWAWIGDEGHPAATSIGIRPTFDNGKPTVEAYLLDFDGDLYGQTLGLSFIKRLRPEMRFENIDALVAQMAADVSTTRTLLGDPPTDAWPIDEGWEELSHTADWAIRVTGESQRQLFARAAAAMCTLQDADPAQPVTLARAITVEAPEPSGLLVNWLSQLLLHQEVAGEMYTRFEIHDISARVLRAVAYGYRGAPAHTAIKAVTYYDLEVVQTEEGWNARVTFDV